MNKYIFSHFKSHNIIQQIIIMYMENVDTNALNDTQISIINIWRGPKTIEKYKKKEICYLESGVSYL